MLLGPVRLLQEIYSVDLKSETPYEGWGLGWGMVCMRGVHLLVEGAYQNPGGWIQTKMGIRLRKLVRLFFLCLLKLLTETLVQADKQITDDPKSPLLDNLSLYATAFTIDPTDYLARLNSAALRLRSATERSTESE